jgi:hypothetical protein
MVAGGTVIIGLLTTVTLVVSEFTHPLTSVAVIVYCVVADGEAVTLAPVVPLKPVAGLQVYVLAPEAVSVVEFPLHTKPLLTDKVGSGFTVTVEVAVAVHPAAEVPVIV